ncbi:MAG TPA: hypothetical protein VGG69_07370 [Rhizomicrobium sp.]
MAESTVGAINIGQLDSTGARIDTVYSKAEKIYAVFRTPERVVVQYADEPATADDQRKKLAALNPVRGEINGLVDGWRNSGDPREQSKARLFDRRVADALVMALQNDPLSALALLNVIKADILAERTSVARSKYVVVAAVATLALLIVTTFFSSPLSTIPLEFKPLWAAASFGALGALFSIALDIRSRAILTDLQQRENSVDAILRILIGALSAAVLYSLLRGRLISLSINGTPILAPCPPKGPCPGADPATYVAILVAFLAGFSERLVGDMLTKISSSISSNPLAGGAGTVSGAPSAGGNPSVPLAQSIAGSASSGQPAAAASPQPLPQDDDAEGCLTGAAVPATDQTSDAELPPATGGVEASPPANQHG